MGKDIYEKYKKYREVYEKASNILNIDLTHLTFLSSEEELSETKNTQIAIFMMSLGILEILKDNGIISEYLSGLSLGEYIALMYANSFSFEDGLKIVRSRGELMRRKCTKRYLVNGCHFRIR